MPDEPIIPPLLITPATMPAWDSKQAAHLIADPSLSVDTAQRQIQRFANLRWIPTVGQPGGRGNRNLFSPTAVAAAKVLSVLNDLGVEDRDTMGLAAVQLFAWNDDQPRIKGLSPVLAAMEGATRGGEFWVFQLTMFRGDQTGRRHVRAWVYDPDVWHPSSAADSASEMMPRAAITVHLTPIFLPLYARMAEATRATVPAN